MSEPPPYPPIDPTSFDLVLVGTGLVESVIAAAASASGKSVLHIDHNKFYGSHFSSLPIHDFTTFLKANSTPPPPRSSPITASDGDDFSVVNLTTRPLYSDVEISSFSAQFLEEQSSKFNLDVSGPRVLFCADNSIDLLLKSGASQYVEFKSIDASFVGDANGKLRNVPDSRASIFKDKTLSLMEKNRLMKFFKLVQGHLALFSGKDGGNENQVEEEESESTRISEEDLESPFVEFLNKMNLPSKIKSIILYAISMADYPKRTINAISSSPAESMDDQNKTRVVVCGGGIIGVCTAYFLAKKGAAVTLVEKSSVACAASGKAGGFLALDWCDGGALSSLARASFNLHRSLAEELNGAESYGYRRLTTLSLTVNESQSKNQKSASHKDLPSWIDGPAGSPRTIGSPETTAQVHPQLFTRTLLSKAVESNGVEVLKGKLERLGVEGGRVDSVVLEDGRVIKTENVVLTLGPWSGNFGILSSLFRVYGLRAHSIVLEPKEADAITPHALFLTYHPAHGGRPMDPEVYPRPTGEVYLCGMSSVVELPEDPEEIKGDPESIQVLKRVAKSVSSHLAEGEARVKAEQACFLPCTDDGIPVIGEIPGVKGCYVGTGHNCWGILNGPATGAALAELILDGKSTIVDLSKFSPARFFGHRKG